LFLQPNELNKLKKHISSLCMLTSTENT